MPIFKIIRFNRYESVKLSISVFMSLQTGNKLFVGWHQSTGYMQKKKTRILYQDTKTKLKHADTKTKLKHAEKKKPGYYTRILKQMRAK